MTLIAISCLVAFVTSAVLTPIVRGLCIRFGIFDSPGLLKIHQRPIPRLGGIAITIAVVAGCAAGSHFRLVTLAPFLGSLAIVWIAGVLDDVRGLPPLIRLAAQAAAGMLLWGAGYGFAALAHSAWNALAICVLTIFFCNAFNFLDGSDGLAAGIGAIVALAFVVAGGASAVHLALIAVGLFGAATGFLIFNLPPASIFMGDGGSTTIGFTIAFLALSLVQSGGTQSRSLMFSFLVAALPLFDALLAVVRRLRAGKSPCAGDRSHFYDLTRARGWTARKIGFVSYGVTALLGIAGCIGLRIQPRAFATLTALTFVALFAIAIRLGSLRANVDAAGYADSEPIAAAVATATALARESAS